MRPELRSPGKVLGVRAKGTIEAILDATRQILLVRGYAGTTIDDIARTAGISRASFYTYFPSKRDVLLVLGAHAVEDAAAVIDLLDGLPRPGRPGDVEGWVERYFTLLDEHGSFAFAWTQAAHQDAELLAEGRRGHLALCRRLGEALARLGDNPSQSPTESGLVAFSALERAWSYCQLYGDHVDLVAVRRDIARVLAASVRGPADRPARGDKAGRRRPTG
jgi:AcrR family transcriptional regulator